MGDDILKGTTYTEGQQVNAANLNALVDNATIKYSAISNKTLKDPASLSDELLINDDGTLKKITLQQISSLVTIPSGTITDFAGSTAPAGWLMCFGQAVSRVTYAALFNVVGIAFGAGDGSSTFSLPDCRGRASIGKDDMGGVSANRVATVFDGDVLGGVGGTETFTLTTTHMASHTHTAPSHVHNNPAHQHNTSSTHAHNVTVLGYIAGAFVGSNVSGSGYNLLHTPSANPTFTSTGSAAGLSDLGGATQSDAGSSVQATTATGGGAAHSNMPPSIVFNKMIKI